MYLFNKGIYCPELSSTDSNKVILNKIKTFWKDLASRDLLGLLLALTDRVGQIEMYWLK